jgi:hypothetical protein
MVRATGILFVYSRHSSMVGSPTEGGGAKVISNSKCDDNLCENSTLKHHYSYVIFLTCRPFNCMETFTPCIFLAYFGDIFFSIILGHSVTASC